MSIKLGTTTASLYLGSTPVAAYLGAEQVYSAVPPEPATLYFNGAVYDDWTEVGNWWLDDEHTQPAGRLPTSADSVVATANITASGQTVVDFTLSDPDELNVSLFGVLTVTGFATFNDGTGNVGTINGNAIFNNALGNDGTINGNAIFNGNTSNYNTVTGNATFNNSSSNQGTVDGTVTCNTTGTCTPT